MSWSARRKTSLLGGLIAFVVLLVVAFGYYLYPSPSCTDLRQNKDETGIDCGGSCERVCLAQTLPVSVDWVRPFVVAPGAASVVAYVTNPNVALFAKDVPYIFRLYDDKNLLVAERKGRATVLSKTSFPVFEGVIEVGARTPVRADFEFTGIPLWRKQSGSVSLQVSETILESKDTMPRLSAMLANRGLETVRDVEAVAVLYDGSGNAIAASRTVVESIGRDEMAPLIFTWPMPFPVPVARVLIYPKASASL